MEENKNKEQSCGCGCNEVRNSIHGDRAEQKDNQSNAQVTDEEVQDDVELINPDDGTLDRG